MKKIFLLIALCGVLVFAEEPRGSDQPLSKASFDAYISVCDLIQNLTVSKKAFKSSDDWHAFKQLNAYGLAHDLAQRLNQEEGITAKCIHDFCKRGKDITIDGGRAGPLNHPKKQDKFTVEALLLRIGERNPDIRLHVAKDRTGILIYICSETTMSPPTRDFRTLIFTPERPIVR